MRQGGRGRVRTCNRPRQPQREDYGGGVAADDALGAQEQWIEAIAVDRGLQAVDVALRRVEQARDALDLGAVRGRQRRRACQHQVPLRRVDQGG